LTSFRQKQGVADYLDGLGDWSLSVVTGMELVAGALDKKEVREIDIILATYQAVPLSAEVSQLAYNIMKTYSKSNGLDACDAMIAATALYEGRTLSRKTTSIFATLAGSRSRYRNTEARLPDFSDL
jgi:predicted nucleic acid-binding protein